MLMTSSADVRQVLTLTHDLADIEDPSTRLAATTEGIRAILAADVAVFSEVRLQGRQSRIEAMTPSDAFGFWPDLDQLLVDLADEDPVKRHYAATGECRPRRVTDVCERRAWLNGRTYAELFRPVRTPWELILPVYNDFPTRGVAFVLTRGMDFDDREVSIAQLLQPALIALHRPRPKESARAACAPARSELTAAHHAELTKREHEILILLSQGWTAAAIARRAAITPATVRKHLERVYAKLGRHDRLTAVTEARVRGLIR